MKKWIIAAMLALAAVCACPQPGPWMPARAAMAEASDFVLEGSVLTAYTGTDSVVTLPTGVTAIGEGAFAGNTTITEVKFTYNVTAIGKDAFAGCTSLVYVDNASRQSIRTLGEGAFAGCVSLNSLDCFSTMLTEIGARAFEGCAGLKSLTLPDYITAIAEDAFVGCAPAIYCGASSTTAQTLSAIGRTGAPLAAPGLSFTFYSDYGWTVTSFDGSVSDVVIPEGVKTINGSVFSGKAITSVSLPDSLRTIRSNAFMNCTALTELVLPDGVTTVDSYAFAGCSGLRSMRLSQGLRRIGDNAIYGCRNLTEIDIPASVISLGSSSFALCRGLEQVTLHEGLESIGGNAFDRCEKLTTLALPSSLKTLGGYAFTGTAVASVILPENMTECGSQDTTRLIVSRNTVTAQNMATKPNYSVRPFADPQWPELDVYYLIDETTGEKQLQLYKYYEDGRTSYTVPDGIAGIYRQAFMYSGDGATLAEIIVPDSVKTIGGNAFYNQKALRRLVLPDNLTSIGNYIADSSRELQVLCSRGSATARLITKNVYEYGFTDPAEPEYSWRYEGDGMALTVYRGTAANVTVPGGVTAIGDSAFFKNKTLETVTLPEGLKEVGTEAFSGCTKLREASFPSTLETVGRNAFSGDNQLKHVTLPQSLTTLGVNCFLSLETVTLPDNVTTVDTYPFESSCLILCRKDSVTARSISAASESYKLCDPADPDWLWRYEDDGSLSLGGYRGSASAITLPAWASRVAANAQWGEWGKLSGVVIPEGYTEVGSGAFDGTGIRSVTLPASLKTIGDRAFEGAWLDMLQLPEGLESIGENAFWDNDSLTSLTIPKTVTSIPHCIAPHCDELTTVVLPRELTTIADGAFGDALTTVYCYKGSVAEQWANDNGVPLIKYLDSAALESRVFLTGPDTTWIRNTVYEVGGAYAWRTGVSYGVQPPGKMYTLTCQSSNPDVARVDGEQVTFLAPGSATLTITIDKLPDAGTYRLPVQVYTPVRDFTVQETVFVRKSAAYKDYPRIAPADVEPQDANPWFCWGSQSMGEFEWEDTSAASFSGFRIWPSDRLGMTKAEMSAYSGVKRPFLIVTYETIGEVYAAAPARSVTVGETYQPLITVMVDGVEMDNMPYLYTLASSNARVAAPTEDGKLLGVAPGTATITVTARESGKTARFTVTVANVARLTLPSALKTVKREAFLGAPAEEIILPDGCETIESHAFADCTRLRSVTIPATVTSIAPDAFEGCTGITVITPAGSTAAQVLGGIEGITVVAQ
ncbi:MAG: leucine-rich repeat protein [Candidatus Ventricola sp.]